MNSTLRNLLRIALATGLVSFGMAALVPGRAIAQTAIGTEQASPPVVPVQEVQAFQPLGAAAGPELVPSPTRSPAPQATAGAGYLQSVPQPPLQPGSLFAPALPAAGPPPDLEHPYFEYDPNLNPPQWGQPGWFVDADIAVVHPMLNNLMTDTIGGVPQLVTSGGRPVAVNLGSPAALGMAQDPRVEIGYRLPSGFGAFAISDRGLFGISGNQTVFTADGAESLNNRLSANYTDFDYISREYTPSPVWNMQWRAGWRLAESFTQTSISQSFAQAAAGSGVYYAQQTNKSLSTGPHFTIELSRRLPRQGFFIGCLADLCDTTSRQYQTFYAATTTAGTGTYKVDFDQQIPILTLQGGLGWTPPRHPRCSFFAGYIQQSWYNIGYTSITDSGAGRFNLNGFILRWSQNY